MIVSVASAAAPEGDSLVGLSVPPYPAGLEELQGSCISGGPMPTQVCDYSLTVVGTFAADRNAGAKHSQLLAMRNLEPGARRARWQVIDAAATPAVRNGYELQIGGCRMDRIDDNNIVAFVRHGDRDISRDVRWARRFDIATGKLVPVAAKRVDCINQGLGV